MTFKDCVIMSYPTGSRYICNPPVMNTDNDTVILVNGFHDWDALLLAEGWVHCEEYPGGDFRAYRKGEENYIVTEEPAFFRSYVKATEAAKALNLTNKDDRIKLFDSILWTQHAYEGILELAERRDELVALFGAYKNKQRYLEDLV